MTTSLSAATPLAEGRFWLPGPTEVHRDVLAAQTCPIIAHRGAEAVALMERLQPGLQALFGTTRPVVVLTASATALMEAALRNGVRRGLLAVVNGAFSERFAEIARDCPIDVEVLAVPWGQVVDPEAVRAHLKTGKFDAVSLVHSETSTGALNPVADVASVAREFPGVQVIVDSVTGLGGTPFAADEWGLDFALTGSQKALAMPPGLAFGVASERLLERAVALDCRGYYLDLVRMYQNLQKNQTPTTPAVTLMYAAAVQLDRIMTETLEARFTRHAHMAARCHEWVGEVRERTGLEVGVLATQGARSPTVTCITLPEPLSGPAVVRQVRSAGWVIGGGYGRLKESTVRIGHMGDHTAGKLEELLPVVEAALVQVSAGA